MVERRIARGSDEETDDVDDDNVVGFVDELAVVVDVGFVECVLGKLLAPNS